MYYVPVVAENYPDPVLIPKCTQRRARERGPRLAEQRGRRPPWRQQRPNRSEHACHSTLTSRAATLQMRVCSAGHVRPLLVEKARGRMQELQSSKRLTISRLSGRRSYRHLSTSWQTSRRPSAGRPLSCIRFCLGAESATWLSVRLRCVKSHTGALFIRVCQLYAPAARPGPRCRLHPSNRTAIHGIHATRPVHGPQTGRRRAYGPTPIHLDLPYTPNTRHRNRAPKMRKRGGLARASAPGDVHVAH